ncbi:radical SAM/SPASM domain-containing protein [Pelosinus sp. sgz500959]|uniref:radical SAM protein n=1 Tax=Pelosinus sp. sgz500959 TaxID=3242472 RepID=UPI00367106BF
MYYQLQDDCKLVKGAARAAIYDFKTGKVHSINMDAAQLLDACQDTAIEDLWNLDSPDNDYLMDFLNKLCTKELGHFCDTKPSPELPLPYSPIKLDFIWFELTSTCNSKCLHCYAECSPSCPPPEQVPHDRWLSLIDEAKQAGATSIQFIGGEPLLYPAWRELVIKAHNLNYDYIEIFTNGTLVDDDCIDFFKKYNVSIATTLYADNAQIHDKITLQPNSFNKTMTTINKLIDANIPLRVASIIMKDNEHEVENIMKLYEKWGMKDAYPDVVRPTGRGDDQHLQPLHYKKPPIKPPFYSDEYSFFDAHHHHGCLAGKVAVTATGDVIPCIFARSQLCGNILKNSLDEILSGQSLTQCWQTTKDLINQCKDCEYRYACPDCRPLAQSNDSEKNWFAHPQSCFYNPYTGKWSTPLVPAEL